MTQHFDFVVVGGGLAGATAAETLRTEGAEGSIVLLGAESHLPYHRPPLSKIAITADQLPPPQQVLGKDRYRELAVELLLGTPVAAIDPVRKLVHTRPGADIHYERLLIATGASPRRLVLPGAALPQVFYLRSLEDAEAIRARARDARNPCAGHCGAATKRSARVREMRGGPW